MAKLLNGKPIAEQILVGCEVEVEKLRDKRVTPCLAFILVGDNKDSSKYVRNKSIACKKIGIKTQLISLPSEATTMEIVEKVMELNHDDQCHGIIVQQPLPAEVNSHAVVRVIDPAKDVDGLHPFNLGRLAAGQDRQLVACTPQACMQLLREAKVSPAGKHATIVGRSLIVGRPMALLLLNAGATVTICHSQTADLQAECRAADILVVATGKPRLVDASMVKAGATVLDVGINHQNEGNLVGDVDFKSVSKVAEHITPVPGGVGPLTVAFLVRNTVIAALRQYRVSQETANT